MALVQIEFDPADCMFTSDIAREVGVGLFSAHSYIQRHPELPEPIFKLDMPGGQVMSVWTRPDATELIQRYREARARRH